MCGIGKLQADYSHIRRIRKIKARKQRRSWRRSSKRGRIGITDLENTTGDSQTSHFKNSSLRCEPPDVVTFYRHPFRWGWLVMFTTKYMCRGLNSRGVEAAFGGKFVIGDLFWAKQQFFLPRCRGAEWIQILSVGRTLLIFVRFVCGSASSM